MVSVHKVSVLIKYHKINSPISIDLCNLLYYNTSINVEVKRNKTYQTGE